MKKGKEHLMKKFRTLLIVLMIASFVLAACQPK